MVLSVAAQRFHVDADPKIEEVYEALPHIDCGACGYPGCSGYAVAVVGEGAAIDLCIPGGQDVTGAIAAIMGVEAGAARENSRAVILCQGGMGVAEKDFEYIGIEDCRAAQLVQGGPKRCKSGCLGLGTCAAVCPFGAITMGLDGLPLVSQELCTACGVCVRECPVGIITILPTRCRVTLACSNRTDKGKAIKAMCAKGCIKCRMCVKVTESGAVTWGEDFPEIDYDAWTDPHLALAKCPMDCFVDTLPSQSPR